MKNNNVGLIVGAVVVAGILAGAVLFHNHNAAPSAMKGDVMMHDSSAMMKEDASAGMHDEGAMMKGGTTTQMQDKGAMMDGSQKGDAMMTQ